MKIHVYFLQLAISAARMTQPGCAHLVLTADGLETSAFIACDLHLEKQKKFPAGCDKWLKVKHNQHGQTYCIILFRKPTTVNSG